MTSCEIAIIWAESCQCMMLQQFSAYLKTLQCFLTISLSNPLSRRLGSFSRKDLAKNKTKKFNQTTKTYTNLADIVLAWYSMEWNRPLKPGISCFPSLQKSYNQQKLPNKMDLRGHTMPIQDCSQDRKFVQRTQKNGCFYLTISRSNANAALSLC